MTQVTLKTGAWLRRPYEKVLDLLFAEFTKLNTMFTSLYANHVITYDIQTHASRTVYNVFVANRGYTVTSVDYIPDVAQGGALTATVVKAIAVATPASATTPITTAAAVNLNGAAHTVQAATLTGTAADLVLAAGNRIGVVLSGAMTTGTGTLVINLRKT